MEQQPTVLNDDKLYADALVEQIKEGVLYLEDLDDEFDARSLRILKEHHPELFEGDSGA
jgi:hypothetical protein